MLGVEPRIADRVITVLEIGIGDHAGSARAFGNILAGHFKVHPTRVGAFGAMNRKECFHLGENAIEGPGLVAGLRGDGVAVHGIA